MSDEKQPPGTRAAEDKAPKSASEPFRRFMIQGQRLFETVHLATAGITTLCGMPDLVEALGRLDSDKNETDFGTRLDRTKKEADLAEREVKTGFPVIHAQAVVTLWSYLEALLRSFAASWLRNQPEALTRPQVARLRIRLGDFQLLRDEEEKYYYIFDLLDRDIASARSGINRFETILDVFGLAGAVPEGVRKTIHELGQVRNTIVHRGSRVDERLIAACPWLNSRVGDEIAITPDAFGRYGGAVSRYVLIVFNRVRAYFGEDVSAWTEDGERRC